MKVLIGTPIHEVKDYALERWLKSVSKLRQKSPAGLLMIDNSPGLEYIEKVKDYCNKYGITDYEIRHAEFAQNMNVYKKVRLCQEIIRKAFLADGSYDAFFSWECDIILPANALDILTKIMVEGNYMVVAHNYWKREPKLKNHTNFEMGCTLISKKALKKHSFLIPHEPPGGGRWTGIEDHHKMRVFRSGGNFVNVAGKIHPLIHLDRGRQ